MKYRKIIRLVLLLLAALLLLIQFIPLNIESTETVSANEIVADKNIKSILVRSCYDCHSNRVVMPWYSKIAPFSFLIADHVIEGRENLNYSEWSGYSKKKRLNKMDEIVEQIESDEMPLFTYTLMHREAVLTVEQKNALVEWAESEYEKIDMEK